MQKPRSVFITGATSGIGKALALRYAEAGVTLFLTGRNAGRMAAVEKACRAAGAGVHTGLVDVTRAPEMEAFIRKVWEISPVDLVIANAGISAGTGGGGESGEQTRIQFDTNLTGVLNTVLPFIDRMRARGGGQIALMSSLAGYVGLASAPAYCGSKAAVKVWGEGLRGWLGPQGIAVNVICPGWVESGITAVNTFPMPFLMPAEKAAGIIAKRLAKNRGRITFPWPMALLLWAFAALPAPVTEFLGRRIPAKSGG